MYATNVFSSQNDLLFSCYNDTFIYTFKNKPLSQS